jgi:tRNA (guanine37-N1)-methyltransferase
MVMRPDVWGQALDELIEPGRTELLLPTPSGRPFTQRTAERLSSAEHLVLACGRYEGIDGRVAEHYASTGATVTEVSLGDYVLNGGEVAALVVVEAVARLLPGVVGNPESLVEESHGGAGLLEYPAYTRPPVWRGHEVPSVLLSGHHARISRWRRDQSLERTARRRPDLLATLDPSALDRGDREMLGTLGWTVEQGRVVPTDAPVAD